MISDTRAVAVGQDGNAWIAEMLLERGADPNHEIMLGHGPCDVMGWVVSEVRDHPDIRDPAGACDDFNPGLLGDCLARLVIMLARHGALRVLERLPALGLGQARQEQVEAVALQVLMDKHTTMAVGPGVVTRL